MRMKAAELARYRAQLDGTASDARAYVLRRLKDEGDGLDVAGMRELAIEVIEDATGVYGDRAQSTAADLFDEIMEADGVEATARLFDGLIDHGRTEGKVHYYARKLVEGDADGFAADASDLAAYYVHRSAWDNLVRNCDLNRVMWARVPTGRETCTYCLMLASRGFAYHSRDTASHGKHQGCDCVVVPGNKGSTIEGYDPEALGKQWRAFEEIDADAEAEDPRWEGESRSRRKKDFRVAVESVRAVFVEPSPRDPVLRESNARLIANIRKIAPKHGWYDVHAHGSEETVTVFGSSADAKALAHIIRSRSDYNGEPIRLFSCHTGEAGADGTCFAQELSDILGVPVDAPPGVTTINPDGSFFFCHDPDVVEFVHFGERSMT